MKKNKHMLREACEAFIQELVYGNLGYHVVSSHIIWLFDRESTLCKVGGINQLVYTKIY